MNQAQWNDRVLQESIKVRRIVGFGHADVVRPQVTVHGQREQHDIEQATLNQAQIKIVQAFAHVANVGGADHTITSERSADG